MAINFPTNPPTNYIHTENNLSWKFNSTSWDALPTKLDFDIIGTTQGVGETTYNIQAKDEGTLAGNARGESSVDLQTTRTDATEVASGNYSALVAGQNNTASGAGSFCVGGLGNNASNTRAVVMGGNGNTASGSASVVLGGIGCTASGAETLVAGENATASHNGARLFADNFATAFPSIATQEFAIQASALRLVDNNEGAGKVLTSDANGSGNWASPAVFDVRSYGTTGNGTTDDRAAIQAAIDAAELVTDQVGDTGIPYGRSAAVVDLAGGRYRIADTLVISKPIIFQNGSLIATTAMAGVTEPTYPYMIYVSELTSNVVIQNINMDGGLNAGYATATACLNDCIRSRADKCLFSNINIVHFKDYGIFVQVGQDQTCSHCSVTKWLAEDTVGYGDDQYHTGVAFYTTNWNNFVDCSAFDCSTGFRLNNINNSMTGCRFFTTNTPTFTTGEPPKAVHIVNGKNTVTGCNFEGGHVYIEDYENAITGCKFGDPKNNTAGIRIYNFNGTNIKVNGLLVTGCIFTNTLTAIDFTTDGGATYAPEVDMDIQWLGNLNSDASEAWHGNKFGDSGFWDNGRLTIADRASAPDTIAGAATIWVTTNGVLRVKFQNGVVKDLANDGV